MNRNPLALTRPALVAAVALFASQATFGADIDGTLDAAYGPAKYIQRLGTEFGDSNSGQVATANGSELDGAYAYIQGNTLFLMATGNLETNFNKLNVFLQTKAGGTNVIPLLTGINDATALNRLAGLTMDAAFAPNFVFSITSGAETHDIYVDVGDLNAGTQGYAGHTTVGGPTNLDDSGAVSYPNFNVALNNSNIAGVAGGSGSDPEANAAAAALVTTGVEMSFNLADLGWNGTDPILIMMAINGSGNDFYSNQFLPGLPDGFGNMGDPATVNLAGIAGDQFFSVSASAVGTPGDYNGDGFVDSADYTVWADHFGQSGTGIPGDGNNDGVVDSADYTVWADHFGQGTPPGAVAVPEPGAVALIGLPAVALLGRRRKE